MKKERLTAKVLKYDFDVSNHYTFKDSLDRYKANNKEKDTQQSLN